MLHGDKGRLPECGGANKAQGMWLEECQQRGKDVIFVGEVWIPKGRVATINQMGYELVMEIRKSSRIAAYWKQGMGDTCEVIMDEDRAIGIKCEGKRVVGVYAKGNDSRRGYEE